MLKNIPVYLINLDRSPERREFMVNQLNDLNIEFEFIKAVDGQLLSKENLKMYSKWRSLFCVGRELAKNEIGCALSHYNVYKKILNNEHQFCLILEDDSIINHDLINLINEIINRRIKFDLINFKTDAVHQKIYGISDGYYLCKLNGPCNRTAAYLITYKCACTLYKNLLPIRFSADGYTEFMRWKKNLLYYGIFPEIVSLRNINSLIWSENAEWEKLQRAPGYINFANRVIYKIIKALSKN